MTCLPTCALVRDHLDALYEPVTADNIDALLAGLPRKVS
jgi:hypothetical protein